MLVRLIDTKGDALFVNQTHIVRLDAVSARETRVTLDIGHRSATGGIDEASKVVVQGSLDEVAGLINQG